MPTTRQEPESPTRIPEQDEDRQVLHRMGYAQELLRSMGTFQNFAISFSMICILCGGINSFGQGLSSVGGASIGIGWPLACLVSLLFALAMGQIGSAYPTAGGLYHWGSILGGRAVGWVTAWFNLVGLVTGLASINVGCYLFVVGSLGPVLQADPNVLTPANPTATSVLTQTMVVLAITISQALFNHFGIRLTSKLTDFSGYVLFFGSVALGGALLWYAPHLDLARLWTFHNYSGDAGGGVWPASKNMSYLFLLGLMLPAYTITGFDASAHTAEETKGASKAIPKGMVHSVLWSGLFGWAMLAAIVLAAPNMDLAASKGSGSVFWIMGVLPIGCRVALFVVIAVSQYLCGLATVTSTSRMMFAFSRDGGLPWSSVLKRVHHRWRTPVPAIWAVAALAVGFTIYAPVYTTIAAVCTMFLYISYVLPVAAGMIAHGRSWTQMGSFDLRSWYRPIALICVLSCGVLIFIGVQPPNDQALKVLIGALALCVVVWFALERRRFTGPPIGAQIEARQRDIGLAETAVES